MGGISEKLSHSTLLEQKREALAKQRPSGFLLPSAPALPSSLSLPFTADGSASPAQLPCLVGLMGNLDISSPSISLNRSFLHFALAAGFSIDPSRHAACPRERLSLRNPRRAALTNMPHPILILSSPANWTFLRPLRATIFLGRRSSSEGKLPRLFRDK